MTVKGVFMSRSTCPDHAAARVHAAMPWPGTPLAAAVTALMLLLACLLIAGASASVAGAAAKPA
jgi:hypothetical protein